MSRYHEGMSNKNKNAHLYNQCNSISSSDVMPSNPSLDVVAVGTESMGSPANVVEWSAQEAARHLTMLFEPGQLFEIRALEVRSKAIQTGAASTASGVFGSVPEAVEALTGFFREFVAKGVYVTLNPLDPARVIPAGRMVTHAGKTSKDSDIEKRRWILIDCDPTRTAGSNSSEAELGYALETQRRIRQFLKERGFPEPISLMSGNGCHLLYRVDLPADATETVRSFLKALASIFNDKHVKVDTTVCNASRITKLAGTPACKGPDTPERPRRMSHLQSLAATEAEFSAQVVSEQLLGSISVATPKLASKAVSPAAPRNRHLPQLEKIEAACAFMAHCRDDAAQLSESNWYAQLGIVGRCAQGQELAHARSSSHPGYSEQETSRKLRQAIEKAGPRTCQDIQNTLNFEGCDTCPHNGKITSPIELGKVTVSPGKVFSAEDLDALGIKDPHGFLQAPLNDDGNASRFLSVYGEDVLYSADIGRWLVWDGKRWEEDVRGAIRIMAAHAMELFLELVDSLIAENPDLLRTLVPFQKYALSSGNLGRIDSLISLAAGRCPIRQEQLDSHNFLLTVENGTLDFRTGALLPHDRAHRITKLAPVTFDPEARSDLWENHISRVLGGDTTMIAYLQRWAGYCFTGDISARAFTVLHGAGCNGKSVTIEALASVLGEYACHTPPSTFEMHYGGGSMSNDLARLRGIRMVITSETNLGVRLDPGLMKRATGGEKITARFLHKEYFDFRPNFKLIMSTNNKPDLPGDDPAMWSRVKLIPFDVVIPPEEVDPALGEKLNTPENRSAVLNWVLKGYSDFKEVGLNDPEAVQEAISDYRDDQNFFAHWLESECVVNERDGDEFDWESTRKLMESYKKWADENGAPEMSSKRFAETLKKHGCKPRKRSQRGWDRIRLRASVSFLSPRFQNVIAKTVAKLENGPTSNEAA